jgi:hypothetical protein
MPPSFCIDRSDFLKPAELRALHCIADVGAHGYTHRPLSAARSPAFWKERK